MALMAEEDSEGEDCSSLPQHCCPFFSLSVQVDISIYVHSSQILCNNEQEDDIIHTVGQNATGLQSYFFAVSTGTQEDTIL